jgi:alpha-galactosidase
MSVEFWEERRLFLLTTANTAYAIHLTEQSRLVQLYWGARLPYPADYPPLPPNHTHASFNASLYDWLSEFPTPTGIQETEACLRVIFADGTRDLRLGYVGHEIGDEELLIRLKDQFYGLEVGLRYRLYPKCDIFTRRIELLNSGQMPLTLEEILSGSLPLPYDRGGDFRLTHLAGTWDSETQLERSPVTPGRKLLEGRLNYSGHANNPFFALDLVESDGHGATESTGEVWFGALQWSGNWKAVIEQGRSPFKFTRLAAGLNDYDFSWQLEPGQSFETPWLALGSASDGFGQISRNLHRYQLNHVLPRSFATSLRPVLYNSWEAVEFKVNEADQLQLAEKAARLDIEIFVMDDGWFGQRNHDRAGLGDWWPNPQKFPNGLKPLIERVNALGMDFGLWVEPEMVNPDSDLYRAHPDWVYHFPNRQPTTGRNQLILNLARPDVEDWLFGWMDKLLSEHNIRYIKWDYNRAISESGWPAAAREHQREIWVRHIAALYRILDRLREQHPAVLFEACSGGGGRADLGTLSHFDHTHISDNTDPFDRLPIQQGYTLAYAPKTMYTWVTSSDYNQGQYPLRYRFHSAFMGSLCLATNLNRWAEAEMTEAAHFIAQYKRIRPLVQHGAMFRLTPLSDHERLAVEYLAEDKSEGVVLIFERRKHFWQNPLRLRLAGLEPERLYSLSGDLDDREPTQLSGQALMQHGLLPRLEGYHRSAMIILNENHKT